MTAIFDSLNRSRNFFSHRNRQMDYFAVTQRAQCVDIFYFIATNFVGRRRRYRVASGGLSVALR